MLPFGNLTNLCYRWLVYPIIYRVSTILLVMQDFATIQGIKMMDFRIHQAPAARFPALCRDLPFLARIELRELCRLAMAMGRNNLDMAIDIT
jgi:hypothetical protein